MCCEIFPGSEISASNLLVMKQEPVNPSQQFPHHNIFKTVMQFG